MNALFIILSHLFLNLDESPLTLGGLDNILGGSWIKFD